MISSALQQAINCLHIQDVYLRWSRSKCAKDFRPQNADFSTLDVQQMYTPRQVELFEVEGDGKLLKVSLLLGLRWVTQSGEHAEQEVKALIEGEFIAEYRLVNDVPQESIDEFAQKNVIYHVWPYWREYLASQCERLRLPRVMLPTFQLSHHKLQEQAVD